MNNEIHNLRFLFLDLEETLLKSWDDPSPMNISRIKTFIEKEKFSGVFLFSFAVWDEQDREAFERFHAPIIAGVFGIHFDDVITVDDMLKSIKSSTGIVGMDRDDLLTFFGKDKAFIEIANTRFSDIAEVTLIDDMVGNLTVIDDDTNRRITIRNVKSI